MHDAHQRGFIAQFISNSLCCDGSAIDRLSKHGFKTLHFGHFDGMQHGVVFQFGSDDLALSFLKCQCTLNYSVIAFGATTCENNFSRLCI